MSVSIDELDDGVLYELTNPLKQGLALQLDTGDATRGYEHRSLPGGSSTDAYGWQLTEQALSLLRNHRGRGPVLKCEEVDLEKRELAEEKASKEREIKATQSMELKKKLREKKDEDLKKQAKRAALIAKHLSGDSASSSATTPTVPTSTKSKSSPTSKKTLGSRRASVELSDAEKSAIENGEPLPK